MIPVCRKNLARVRAGNNCPGVTEKEVPMFFWKKEKKTAPRKSYDKETLKPAIRCSICSGEKVAGFQEINSGKFHEIQLLRTDADLNEFLEMYGLKKEDVPTIY